MDFLDFESRMCMLLALGQIRDFRGRLRALHQRAQWKRSKQIEELMQNQWKSNIEKRGNRDLFLFFFFFFWRIDTIVIFCMPTSPDKPVLRATPPPTVRNLMSLANPVFQWISEVWSFFGVYHKHYMSRQTTSPFPSSFKRRHWKNMKNAVEMV